MLSYRNLIDMMGDRGVTVTHTSIMRRVRKYSPILDKRIRKHIKLTNDSWCMDEIYIRKKAQMHICIDL